MIATLHTVKLSPAFNFAGLNYPRYIATLPRGSMADRLARRSPVSCGKVWQDEPYPVDREARRRFFYLGDGSQPFTRWAWCDEVNNRIHHSGWFTDEHGDGDKIRGLVVRLPLGRGFLAGWSFGEGMAGELGRLVITDEWEAARIADGMAELAAEACLDGENVEGFDDV